MSRPKRTKRAPHLHGLSDWLYILNDAGEPVQEPDALKWAQWFETHDRTVRHDKVPGRKVFISTVFLGVNSNMFGTPPVLWETMIFGGPHDLYQLRYSSRADAEVGHKLAVNLAKGKGKK